MREDLEREEVHRAVDRLVDELLEMAGLTAPPVDAVLLVRLHVGVGINQPRPRQRRSAQHEPSEEQKQWAAAHAIGERFKAALLGRLGVPPEEKRALAGESLPNLFAGHLLTPTAWFGDDARACGYDLLALKERYRTASYEVLAWRLLDLPEPCVITVVEDGRVRRRRSNAWRVRRELEAPESECQRQVSRRGRPCVVRAGGWTVQGWPVPAAGGTRAVLRGVCDGDVAGE